MFHDALISIIRWELIDFCSYFFERKRCNDLFEQWQADITYLLEIKDPPQK